MANELNFELFTDEQLNNSLIKLKEERLKIIDTDQVNYTRLLHLSFKIEKAVEARAKASPLTQKFFENLLCGI